MPPKHQEQSAIQRVTYKSMKTIDAQVFVIGGLRCAKLGRPEKPAPVIAQQGHRNNDKTENANTVANHLDSGRQAKRRGIAEPEFSQPPDTTKMKHREPVIGKTGIPSQTQGGLHTVGGQYGMQCAERRPGEAIPNMFDNDGSPSGQDAFIRAIVDVVLKPGTISARTTLPP